MQNKIQPSSVNSALVGKWLINSPDYYGRSLFLKKNSCEKRMLQQKGFQTIVSRGAPSNLSTRRNLASV